MNGDGNSFNKNSPLHDFMRDPLANKEDVMRLLNKDPPVDVNAQNCFGRTPMMEGILNNLNDSQIIQIMLKRTKLEITDESGDYLLHYFGKYGIVTCIGDLLTTRSLVLAQNKKGETALHHVQNGNIMKKILSWYAAEGFSAEAKNWPENSSDKSEMLTNLEDFLKDPDKFPRKIEVIKLFCDPETKYPVPKDMSQVISKLLKNFDESSAESMYDILSCVLKFGASALGELHIKEAIKSDVQKVFNWTVEYFTDEVRKNIICSTDVLLSCLTTKAKKNGDNFYKQLESSIDINQLVEIKDEIGSNVAHYICKYGKCELLQRLLEKDQDVAAKLFGTTNDENLYPLAFLAKDPELKFLENFRNYFASPQRGFENITLASPTKNLLHFAIEKRKRYVSKLLDVDFPLSNDVNRQTPLHKVVRFYDREQQSLLERLLSCQHEDDDIEYINKKDVFDFTALDYTILFLKEEQFKFLRQRNARFDKDEIEKIVNYLVFKEEKEPSDLNFILEDLEISYPSGENKEDVQKIARRRQEALQAKQDTQLTSSRDKDEPVIFNILIAHSSSAPITPKESDDNKTVVLCHSLPFEMLSIDHLDNFTNLVNKQLYLVQDLKEPSLHNLLSQLFDVEAKHVKSVPESFNKKRLDATRLDISPPRTEILDHQPDREVKPVDESFRADLESHRGKSGYFFVSQGSDFYSRSFYSMNLEASDIAVKAALVSFKLLDSFYSEEGSKDFSERIRSNWTPGNSTASKHFDFRARYKRETNVSRFCTSLISSLLISKFMLIPRNDNIMLLSPDILVSFHVHTQDNSKHDFVRVTICNESNQDVSVDIWQYFLSLLRCNEVQFELKKHAIELLQRGSDVSISESTRTSEGVDGAEGEKVDSNNIRLDDLEAADPLISSEEKERLEGGSLLMNCLADSRKLAAILRRRSIKLPAERYFQLDPSCDMIRENPGGVEENYDKLLHRIVLTKKNYTIRQFIQDGKYTEKERLAICKGLGIDVAETYSKLYNCWRLNWADFLVLGLGVVIVVAILVGCQLGGVDLESYGVAGIATVPFVLSLLNRVRLSYSHSPEYSKLPDIHNPGG